MNVKKSFLGTGWAFPPHFGNAAERGSVAMVDEEQDIHESLFIILSTMPGERIMQPTFGCGLKAHVFDELNESVVTEIRDAIERAILFFEPRISVNAISMDESGALDGRLDIHIDYTVRGTNTRSNMVYPFYYLEGSNVPNK
ncbi:phage baseplate assembly protein W [Herbaspirillum sp. CF444]|uniref:GPW/gp25 family protein n=1 Tax=Herbaspirillum sp. CF444 TaxID=1144319 RepID=UPI0002724BD4|nr:GPW/gp25 family protein [Herbaspirillum sp. CF444]EJL89766.1 phage baseplate assembly protein W [Herbaspirillum sp. CF444]